MITKTDKANSVSPSREKRDTLYYGYRYQLGSYKARKAGIEPTLMSASREGSGSIRLYDLDSGHPTQPQEQFAIMRFKQWRQEERELQRRYRVKQA